MQKMDEALFTKDQQNTLLCLPPSGGKTFVATQYCDTRWMQKGGKGLWLAHREELIEQALEDAQEYCPGRRITTWYQGGKDLSGDLVVASVPSQRSLLKAVAEQEVRFDFIVIDEAHHAAADSYQAVIDGIPHKKRLGLTGTPKRMDNKVFAFDNIAFQIKFMELVDQGWCARPTYIRYRTRQNHLFQIKAGDFTASSLKSLNNAPRNEMVAKEFFDHPEYWPAMIYTVNVEHAWKLREAMLEMAKARGRSARVCVVTGETKKDERRAIVQDFRDGKVDALLNCMVFTEGTDLPTIKSIFLTRPTMSETLYLQMALRGGRSKPGYQATGNDPSPGKHPNNRFWIVDFVDSAHHYAAASRGFALRSLDKKQVNKEIGLGEDAERAAQIVKEVPKAFSEFDKKFRGIKYEEDELTPEQWVISKVGAVLITSSPFEFEKQWVLTAEQDFAVLCGTEYVWSRYAGWTPSKEERDALISHTYDLFGKGKFTPVEWKTIIHAWIGFKRYKKAKQDANGGRTWLHLSSVESPPLEEVEKAIEEIEAESRKVDEIFEDEIDAFESVRDLILEKSPPEYLAYWKEQLALIFNVTWGDKQFAFHYDDTPDHLNGWCVEAVVAAALRRLTERDDIRVTMTFKNPIYGPCPACDGDLVLRSSVRGKFYGCTRYPNCKASAQAPSRAQIIGYTSEHWKSPAQ